MNEKHASPEICCDLNARMTENGYSLQIRSAIDDLARLGLTLEQAVGRRFLFNAGADTNENGELAEIIFYGVVAKTPEWGYLALCEPRTLRWRVMSEAEQSVQPDRREDAAPG